MRSVAIPPHRYADYAQTILTTKQSTSNTSYGYGYTYRTPQQSAAITAANEETKLYARLSRAYTRVVVRLRAQADAEVEFVNSLNGGLEGAANGNGHGNGGTSQRNSPTRGYSTSSPVPPSSFPYASPSGNGNGNGNRDRDGSKSRPPSRSASRAGSIFSNEQHNSSRVSLAQSHLSHNSHSRRSNHSRHRPKFRSTLYRPSHAPLLRVFVLSPEGPWMSDTTILDCEAELKIACTGSKGRMGKGLLRVGDVVWNCSIGDEANLGRSIWDGNFLIVCLFLFFLSFFPHLVMIVIDR